MSGSIADNPNYWLHLTGKDETGRNIDIVANLPEHFTLATSAHWEPVLSRPDLSLLANGSTVIRNLVAGAQKTVGLTAQRQELSYQTWLYTDPLSFNIPIQLQAWDNPQADVTDVVATLISLMYPAKDPNTGFFRSPGPTLLRNTPYNLFLRIGNRYKIPYVIVLNAQLTSYTIPEQGGNWITADMDITFASSYLPSKQEILEWLGSTTTSQSSGGNLSDTNSTPPQ